MKSRDFCADWDDWDDWADLVEESDIRKYLLTISLPFGLRGVCDCVCVCVCMYVWCLCVCFKISTKKKEEKVQKETDSQLFEYFSSLALLPSRTGLS